MERKLLVSLSKSVEGDRVKDLIQEEIVLLGLKVHEKGQQNDGTWGWMIGYQSQADKISIQILLRKLQDKQNSKLSIKQLDQQTQTKVSQKGKINEEKSQENKKDVSQQDMNKNNQQKEKDEGNDSFDQLSESSDGFQVLDNGKSLDQEKSEGFEGDDQEMKRQGDVVSPKQQDIQMEQVVELVQLGSQSAQQQSIAQEIQQQQHSQENQNIKRQVQKAQIVNAQQHVIKPVIKDQQTKQLDQQSQQGLIQELKIENDENKEDIDRVDDTTEVLIKYYQQNQYKQKSQLQYQRKQKQQDKEDKQEQQKLRSSQSIKYIRDLQQQVIATPQQFNQYIVSVDHYRDKQVKYQKQSKQLQPLSQRVQTQEIVTDHNGGKQLININIDSRQQQGLVNSRQEDINQQQIKKIGGQQSISFKIRFQQGENQYQDKQQKQQRHQQHQQQLQQQPTQHQLQQHQHHHHHQQTILVNKQQPIISIDYQYQPISTQPAFNQHSIHHHSEKDQLINTQQQFSQQLVLDESCHQLLSKKPINLSHQQPKADQQMHPFQSNTYQQTSQDSLQLSENSLTYINQPYQEQPQTINQSTNKQHRISTSQEQRSQSSKQSLPTTLQGNKQRRQPLINKALLQMKNMQPSSTIQMIQDKQQSDRLYPVQNSTLTSTNISNTNNPSKTLKRSLLEYNNQAQNLSTLSLSYYNNQRYVIMCLLAGVLVLMCYLFYL